MAGLALIASWQAWQAVGKRSAAPTADAATDSLPAAWWTLLFTGFSLAYLLLHIIVSFQTWDRYLLPLAPLTAMLSARGALLLWERTPAWGGARRWGLAVILAAVLVWGGWRAATAAIPVGGDHGAYTGLLDVARYLDAHTPRQRGVIYQRWLGWQWDWYLWDRQDRVYWADEAMLIEDLARDPAGYTRFVVFPAWHLDEKPKLERALAEVGLTLSERLRVNDPRSGELRFVVYQITPIP